jgi:hypothetical protein
LSQVAVVGVVMPQVVVELVAFTWIHQLQSLHPRQKIFKLAVVEPVDNALREMRGSVHLLHLQQLAI